MPHRPFLLVRRREDFFLLLRRLGVIFQVFSRLATSDPWLSFMPMLRGRSV
jgi:hypothetical protein